MLLRGTVDCEGWDIIKVLGGREGERDEHAGEKTQPSEKEESPAVKQRRSADALEQCRAYLRDGNSTAALCLSQKIAGQDPDWLLPEAELLEAIRLLHHEKSWAESVEPMVQCLKRFPERATPMRLKLAQILLIEPQRPFKALAVLAKIPADALTPAQDELRRKLEAKANQLAEHADLEVADEDC
jgi:hypothetical protein